VVAAAAHSSTHHPSPATNIEAFALHTSATVMPQQIAADLRRGRQMQSTARAPVTHVSMQPQATVLHGMDVDMKIDDK